METTLTVTHNGQTHTRTTHRDYRFVAISEYDGRTKVTWHLTLAAAQRETRIRLVKRNAAGQEIYRNSRRGCLLAVWVQVGTKTIIPVVR